MIILLLLLQSPITPISLLIFQKIQSNHIILFIWQKISFLLSINKSLQNNHSLKMKNQQSPILQSSALLSDKKTQVIFCSKGKLAKQACSSQSCTKYAFLCYEEECPCQKQHEACCKTLVESLIQNLEKKIIPIKQFESSINSEFDKLIDELSQLREGLIKKIKQELKYYGLSREQKHVLHSIKTQNVKQVNGQDVWKAHLDVYEQYRQKKFMDQMHLTLNNIVKQIHQVKEIMTPVKSTLETFIHDHNYQASQYQFSSTLKYKKITIHQNNTKANVSIGYGLVLVDGVVFKKGSSIKFKIFSNDDSIRVGLGIRNIIVANQYQVKNRGQIGHGCFLMQVNGLSWCHSHDEYNNARSDFVFHGQGVIEVRTNGSELCFVNESQKKEIKMKIKLTEDEWKQACFCVFLGSDWNTSSVYIVK